MEKVEIMEDRIFLLKDFVSERQCEDLIRQSEDIGYEVGNFTDTEHVHVRHNVCALLEDETLAASFFDRAQPHLPPKMEERSLHRLYDGFRFYRYDKGQYFKPHRDGAKMLFRRPVQQSYLTFMIYLNAHFEGGETNFFATMLDARFGHVLLGVKPEPGTALIFKHDVWHEGAAVTSGRKYTLRTDVMYVDPPRR
ncbi:MAG TPA: oxidoreductase, 2OG-Fe(II) oxygenase [Myxococcales bacterium]|nr:oxidoreductase, 2OG-Fe(II) oxygenase [Deltaproteobacteria bacterium]MBU47413.1 oxidoreductase, 2OG-Fe(II) oxygenase [Deltaproteobacteria bacterium]HAA53348.1 oxidoreductase, 2OG-Fe(II) oxygenase [Myxococcales bacterium]|tara:strand:- start:6424 stop:7008 length:585 start_codon:yes stop_codon:yes gene_type:complete